MSASTSDLIQYFCLPNHFPFRCFFFSAKIAVIKPIRKYKYIDNFKEKSAELFDLDADPEEKNNLLEEKPELAENMRMVLKNQIQFHQSAAHNFFNKHVE